VTLEPATIVVPCYNEAQRLDGAAFVTFVTRDANLRVLFVDDGSRDTTFQVLDGLRKTAPDRIDVLKLERNSGKAEAVRQGLLKALESGATIIGYLDADLATPVDEMARLLQRLRASDALVLLGSRVALLGRSIERKPIRHYLGRVFASSASLVLRVSVYDTQCGAKLFRRTPALESALGEPFLSRWLFDVELLGRILVPRAGLRALKPGEIVEEPLLVWRDIPGSKLRPQHFLTAILDMSRIAADLRSRRHRATPRGG
jgi:dolichyl-phosphate beta-glucosyltransferase